MIIKKAILLFSVFSLLACSGDDENANTTAENGINSYRFHYMDYPLGTANSQNNITVNYYNGKIVKLIGGVSELAQESGYSFVFNQNRYTDISYSNNTATIIQKDAFYTDFANKQSVTFTSNGQLKSKISIDYFDPNVTDTIQYFYQNGILKSFEKHNRRLISKSEIYYNAEADVDSIVTLAPNYNASNQPYFDPESKERSVRKFLNFDNNDNPFKAFIIFDEAFHRSLSAHNYSKWEETNYDYDGHVIGYSWRAWTYIRENGIINFAL